MSSSAQSDSTPYSPSNEATITASNKTHRKSVTKKDHANGNLQTAETAEVSGVDVRHSVSEDSENGSAQDSKDVATAQVNGSSQHDVDESSTRIDDAVRDRTSLKQEVVFLRKSLEELQQRYEEARSSKEHADSRYQKLLGQVNTIKTQLGERLKADAEELLEARGRITALEEENKEAKSHNETLQSQVSAITEKNELQASEIDDLRSRAKVSQQNWARERDDLANREAAAREEFENAKQVMQDWEVLAMEERNQRGTLSDKVQELQEQLSSQKEEFDRTMLERDTQSSTVDGLQRALQETHEARKQERRELVESSQTQIEELRAQLKIAEESSSSSKSSLETAQQELDRLKPFEKEIKEKNLLIGKLRHEAVILNDHLTKALRFLRKGRPEDNVDRQLVTNHFLQFLALERSDPKKFQVLQLISALLSWNDEQNEAAGLTRPGALSMSSTLRVPLSQPFRRVSSAASLHPMSPTLPPSAGNAQSISTDALGGSILSPGANKESLAELWSEFLEREAEQGQDDGSSSRNRSRGSSHTSTPTLPPTTRVVTTGSPATGSGSSPVGRGREARPPRLEDVHEADVGNTDHA